MPCTTSPITVCICVWLSSRGAVGEHDEELRYWRNIDACRPCERHADDAWRAKCTLEISCFRLGYFEAAGLPFEILAVAGVCAMKPSITLMEGRTLL